MDEKKDAPFDTVQVVEAAAQAVSDASRDIAACVPAYERVNRAFDRLCDAAQPLRRSQEELVAEVETLMKRVDWHLTSAKKCIRAGAIYHPERYLEAYRQVLQANVQLRDITIEIADRFPEAAALIAGFHESLRKTDELANRILDPEMNLLFVRTATDSPNPKKPPP